MHRYGLVAGLTAALMLGQAFVDAGPAYAQCPDGAMLCNRVSADVKGTLAGGIIGAEIGFMIPAIIVGAGARELDEAWAYILFPAVFAAGGAVAGYFALEDPTTTDMMTGTVQRGFPEVAVALLAVGVALIVPTFVGVLALTAYSPGADEDDRQGASGDEDAADGEDSGASESDAQEPEETPEQSAIRRTLAGGPGLLRFDEGHPLLGVPMIHATQTFTQEEQEHMGLTGSQDLRIPLVSGVF